MADDGVHRGVRREPGVLLRAEPEGALEHGCTGSLLATALWVVSSLVFNIYVANFGNYNATYGAIGGVIVVLLWLYVSGLAILVGAELDSVIRARAWGPCLRARRP